MAAPKRISVLTEQIGDSTTIRPGGEIDVSSAWTLADALHGTSRGLALRPSPLDLTRVNAVDARGLRDWSWPPDWRGGTGFTFASSAATRFGGPSSPAVPRFPVADHQSPSQCGCPSRCS